MNMGIFLCKMCGRTLKSEVIPNYCYADRMDGESMGIEGINDEQALNMGIPQDFLDSDEMFEFPGDVKFDPFTGEVKESIGRKLSDFQDEVMARVS